MKLISYRRNGVDGWGVLTEGGVVDMAARLGEQGATLRDALGSGVLPGVSATDADFPLDAVALALPVPNAEKVFCVGQNYAAHIHEMGYAIPKFPAIFMRTASSFSAHGEPIVRPKASECLDYEAELTGVIGKRARHVAEADALEVVAGYTIMNDGSVRDWQSRGPQVTPGKNFHRSGALGPCIVTVDEIPDPAALTMETRVNGESRQHTRTDDMVFTLQRLIHVISTFTWLEPGDMISTGSPSGVAAGFDPPRWLVPGDVVEMEISGIGVLRNEVVDE